jgi:integrase-like protein
MPRLLQWSAAAAGGGNDDDGRYQQRDGVPSVCVPVGGDGAPVGRSVSAAWSGGAWSLVHRRARAAPDGRQKRLRRGGFVSRAAAEEGLAEVLELPGREVMAESWTVKRWLEYWLSQLDDRLRPSTVRAYRSVTRTHLIPWLGRFRLADLDGRRGVKTVQRAVDTISRQELVDGDLIAPETVHRAVAVCVVR